MNKKENEKILQYAKKIKAIEYLGGKCQICGNVNWYHMEFHHIKNKKFNISRLLNMGYNWNLIQQELDKCQLYCRNCHQELHFNERNSDDNRQITKQIYINYKGNKCEECGYVKCQASLTFHHLNPNEKEIQFSNISERLNNFDDIRKNILDELNKCQLLCCNCHNEKHVDIDFFEKNKELIYDKLKNFKERKKIDHKEILELYNSGMKQIEICKKLKLSKSTVCTIINGFDGSNGGIA